MQIFRNGARCTNCFRAELLPPPPMSQARSPCSCDALRKASLSTPSGASSEGAGHTLPRSRNLCVRIPFLAPRALPIRPPWLMRDGPLGTRLARTLYRPSKDSEIPLPMYPALARAPKTFGHCSCCPNDARPTASVRKVKMGLHFFMRPVYPSCPFSPYRSLSLRLRAVFLWASEAKVPALT